MKLITGSLVIFFAIFALATYEASHQITKSPIAAFSNRLEKKQSVSLSDTSREWLLHGRNYYEDRYSPLEQINKNNVNKLGLVWSLNLGTERGIEATPLVADGIMYLPGPWSVWCTLSM